MCVIASSIKGLHNKTSSFVIIRIICNFLDPPPQVLQSDITKLFVYSACKEHVSVGWCWLLRSVFFFCFYAAGRPLRECLQTTDIWWQSPFRWSSLFFMFILGSEIIARERERGNRRGKRDRLSESSSASSSKSTSVFCLTAATKGCSCWASRQLTFKDEQRCTTSTATLMSASIKQL